MVHTEERSLAGSRSISVAEDPRYVSRATVEHSEITAPAMPTSCLRKARARLTQNMLPNHAVTSADAMRYRLLRTRLSDLARWKKPGIHRMGRANWVNVAPLLIASAYPWTASRDAFDV